MKDLKTRQKQREYLAKVNSGEIKDPRVTLGTDESGNVIGDDGKPVAGTNPGGEKTNANPTGENGGGSDASKDYSKLTRHEDLDKALEGRTAPDGWGDMKVTDKQAWLTEHPAEGSNTGAGSPGNGGWGGGQ